MSKSLEELQELAERNGGGEASSPANESEETAADSAESTSRLGRTPFSVKGFLLTVVVLTAGLVVGSAVPLLGGVVRYVGLFAAAFALGLLRSRRAYLETAVAGALAAGGAFLLGTLTTGGLVVGTNLLADYGVPVAGVGVTVGALLGVAGLYFGRDLRAGLTRDIE